MRCRRVGGRDMGPKLRLFDHSPSVAQIHDVLDSLTALMVRRQG